MAEKMRFEKLFEPGYIGNLRTQNRMVRSGAGAHSGDKDGYLSDKGHAFYQALARGGIGLIIIEGHVPTYSSMPPVPGFLSLNDDKYIPSFRKIAQTIHGYGCPALCQMGSPMVVFHPGNPPERVTVSPQIEGEEWGIEAIFGIPVRPDMPYIPGTRRMMDVGNTGWFQAAREITISEIGETIELFVKTAERAQKAGVDGIEINGATGLANEFLSLASNRRQDQYGCQNMENRTRFLVELLQALKKRLGWDYPITVLFSGAEFGIKNGLTTEDSQQIAPILEAAGADGFQVRAPGHGAYGLRQWLEHHFYPEKMNPLPGPNLDWSRKGPGAYLPLVYNVKKMVKVPVMTVGRFDYALAEQTLREGKADFIQMQRRLLADPDYPNKVKEGKFEDIAPCTACLTCCSNTLVTGVHECRVNAALKDGNDYAIQPTDKPKKVLVIGGGPAGMEAARVAALKGHQVVLYEKETKLGGLLPLAALVRGTEIEDMPALVKYLETQIIKLGVDIRLGKEFKPAMLNEIQPEAIIVAAGGKAVVPNIPGIERSIVVSGASLHLKLKTLLRHSSPENLRSLTRLWMPVGKNIVIIGGTIQGVELAEFLVKRGRKVTIVDSGPEDILGQGLPIIKWIYLYPWLHDKGVKMITDVKYEEITDKGLVISTRDGEKQTLEADSIATAVPFAPYTEFIDSLKGKIPQVYAIGDSSKPGLIIDAISDGYRVATSL